MVCLSTLKRETQKKEAGERRFRQRQRARDAFEIAHAGKLQEWNMELAHTHEEPRNERTAVRNELAI